MTLPLDRFPRLTPENHREASPESPDYNCVAWAAEDTQRWWQPRVYWPVDVSREEFGVGTLTEAFVALGYQSCGMDGSLESGFQKVALYGSALMYTHAARQLPSGKWTSKLGRGVDIEHDTPDAVAGGIYGEVFAIMKRVVAPPVA
jgi:hypothetical protein